MQIVLGTNLGRTSFVSRRGLDAAWRPTISKQKLKKDTEHEKVYSFRYLWTREGRSTRIPHILSTRASTFLWHQNARLCTYSRSIHTLTYVGAYMHMHIVLIHTYTIREAFVFGSRHFKVAKIDGRAPKKRETARKRSTGVVDDQKWSKIALQKNTHFSPPHNERAGWREPKNKPSLKYIL